MPRTSRYRRSALASGHGRESSSGALPKRRACCREHRSGNRSDQAVWAAPSFRPGHEENRSRSDRARGRFGIVRPAFLACAVDMFWRLARPSLPCSEAGLRSAAGAKKGHADPHPFVPVHVGVWDARDSLGDRAHVGLGLAGGALAFLPAEAFLLDRLLKVFQRVLQVNLGGRIAGADCG